MKLIIPALSLPQDFYMAETQGWKTGWRWGSEALTSFAQKIAMSWISSLAQLHSLGDFVLPPIRVHAC